MHITCFQTLALRFPRLAGQYPSPIQPELQSVRASIYQPQILNYITLNTT